MGSTLLIPSKRQGQTHKHLFGPVPRRTVQELNGTALHGMGMPRIRPKRGEVEEEHAVWNGISG